MAHFEHYTELPGEFTPNDPPASILWERLDDGRVAARVTRPYMDPYTFGVSLLDIAADTFKKSCPGLEFVSGALDILSDGVKAHAQRLDPVCICNPIHRPDDPICKWRPAGEPS